MDRTAKHEALTMQAAKVVSYGADLASIRHALHTADHQGWQRGFEQRGEIEKKYGPDLDQLSAIYFVLGVVVGGLIVALITRTM